MPFPTDMVLALTNHRGPKGELLGSILSWERGEFDHVSGGLEPNRLAATHAEALAWAQEAARELLGPDDAALADAA